MNCNNQDLSVNRMIRPETIRALTVIAFAFAAFVASAFFHEPVFSEELISSDRLIEKLAPPPPVRTRGLVKTTGPDIGDSASAAKVQEATAGSVMLKIQFTHDSSTLSADSEAQLFELGTALNSQQLALYDFEIAGHTDAIGDREYNRQLSIRRANAVKTYLISNMGVSESRLKTVGWGEDRPLISKKPYHANNRRVEIINLGR